MSTDELRELLLTVGYSEVEVVEDYDREWICAVGGKPTQFLDKQG